MIKYRLYHMPGSCSRVALNALEEIGAPYREQGVALMLGAHRTPEFHAINPKEKVPVLVANGKVVTELPVILYHLARANRETGLLPSDTLGEPDTSALSDLVWIAGALHPLANRLMRPAAVSAADPTGVTASASEQLSCQAGILSARIGQGAWLYGDSWSIADVFVAWVYDIAAQCGFPRDDFPVLVNHSSRVAQRPSYAGALAVERHAVTRDNLPLPPGITL